MSVATSELDSVPALVIGDPLRAPVGRAVAATLVTAVVFVVFAWTSKEIRALYGHAPWQNDPYDAVVSFTLFFVPLGAALLVIRALLCRRDAPLPVTRVVGVLRASRVVLAAVLVTLAADWLSVLLRADEETWTATTEGLVVALAIVTLVAGPAAFLVHHAGLASRGWRSPAGPDALADALALGLQWSARLGPVEGPARALVTAVGTHAAPLLRRHPLAAAALGSLAFGAAICVAAVREEGVAPVLGLVFGVAFCGMFAFLAAAGSYLGLVRAEQPLVGAGRRLADAAVLAAAAVPVALAFRGSLWWIVGSTEPTADLVELVDLLLVAAVATFALVVVAETLVGLHRGRQVE